MKATKLTRVLAHAVGIGLCGFVLIELFTWPLGLYKARQFRRVEVLEVGENGPGGRLFIQVRANTGEPTQSTTVSYRDRSALQAGSKTWLMTADWNIKGPIEQRVTLWRLITAYHLPISLLYPIWLLVLIINKIRRRAHA